MESAQTNLNPLKFFETMLAALLIFQKKKNVCSSGGSY